MQTAYICKAIHIGLSQVPPSNRITQVVASMMCPLKVEPSRADQLKISTQSLLDHHEKCVHVYCVSSQIQSANSLSILQRLRCDALGQSGPGGIIVTAMRYVAHTSLITVVHMPLACYKATVSHARSHAPNSGLRIVAHRVW